MTEQTSTDQQQAAQEDGDVMLLCVDGSDHSKDAFNFYRNTLHKEGNVLWMVHISDCAKYSNMQLFGAIGVPGGLSLDHSAIDAQLAKIKQYNDQLEADFIKMCNDANIKHRMETISGENGVEHSLMDYIKAHSDKIKAILMGSRGCGMVKRTFVGSVSHHILHHSHLPVIICPPTTHK